MIWRHAGREMKWCVDQCPKGRINEIKAAFVYKNALGEPSAKLKVEPKITLRPDDYLNPDHHDPNGRRSDRDPPEAAQFRPIDRVEPHPSSPCKTTGRGGNAVRGEGQRRRGFYLRVPVSPRLRVPVSPRLRVPVSPRLRVPAPPCLRVPASPYLRVPASPSPRVSFFPLYQ